jgi:large subunit ribosomal protein L31e
MAKEEKSKIVLERTYIIPLRKEVMNSPRYKRAKRAVAGVKRFLIKHMKSEEIRIGRYLNLKLWEHGIKNPPLKVKVNVTKDDKGVVSAELFDAPKKEEKKSDKKKEDKKSETVEKKVEDKKVDAAESAKKEVKTEEPKKLVEKKAPVKKKKAEDKK